MLAKTRGLKTKLANDIIAVFSDSVSSLSVHFKFSVFVFLPIRVLHIRLFCEDVMRSLGQQGCVLFHTSKTCRDPSLYT